MKSAFDVSPTPARATSLVELATLNRMMSALWVHQHWRSSPDNQGVDAGSQGFQVGRRLGYGGTISHAQFESRLAVPECSSR
jgi:hypothetical protein